jgi:very-short-patch-repair endonuclease
MTDAERKLWFALRDRRFAGFKFRRQVLIEVEEWP